MTHIPTHNHSTADDIMMLACGALGCINQTTQCDYQSVTIANATIFEVAFVFTGKMFIVI